MMRALLMLTLGLVSGLAQARPGWAGSVPRPDAQYRYYLGVASQALTESRALQLATANAYRQAIRENFGSFVQIGGQTYATATALSSVTRIAEQARGVQVEGFEQLKRAVLVSRRSDPWRYDAWVLFRYSRAAIAAERRRLRAVPDREPAFSEHDQASGGNSVTLVIATAPADAQVIIDGEIWGRTPLRLVRAFAAGPHRLVIDHPHHELVREELLIVPGSRIEITKQLVLARAFLALSTSPQGAEVRINDARWGETPLAARSFPVGVPLRLDIRHPQAEPALQEVTLARDEARELSLPLVLRPAFVSLVTAPADAKVTINGQPQPAPITRVPVSAGPVRLRVEKTGFEPYATRLTAHGGQHLALDVIRLRRADPNAGRREPWAPGISLLSAFAGDSVEGAVSDRSCWQLQLEPRWFGLLTTRLSGALCDADGELYTGDSGFTEYAVSIPVYWGHRYVYAEYGLLSGELQRKLRNAPRQSLEQQFRGLGVGASSRRDACSGWCALWFMEAGLRQYSDPEAGAGALSWTARLGLRFAP